ncbi:MAG TPA: phosphoribosylamine--glycine ligase [Candidatus Limnocylindrales bacterium]
MTPTRILLVGQGAREHALVWKLAREPGVNRVVVAPGSAAISDEPRVRTVPGADVLDIDGLTALAREEAVELAVIGPEAPLALGVADALRDAGVPVFGPGVAAARIETSKAFCHEVATAAGVRMARAAVFDEFAPAVAFARELMAEPGSIGVVVKADGLAGGKGVTVCDDVEQAEDALGSLLAELGSRVVVEERLTGPEASLIAICDGRDAVALSPARDHKRLRDGDAGPNTGGMGAYSPLPDLPDDGVGALLDAIHRPILADLARRGTPFRGALYAGLMLTADGPAVLECNARFGDPETQVQISRLGVAIGPLLLAAARGELTAALRPLGIGSGVLPTTREATVGIVLATDGYPAAPRPGDVIEGLDHAKTQGALVFHGATERDPEGRFRTAGGRVLTVVGRGIDLEAARGVAERAADAVGWPGLQRRHDIAAGATAIGAGR